MRDFLTTVARAFAGFVLEMSAEGGRWEFTDLVPGKVIVEVHRVERVHIQIREWTEIKEPVAV